jgi:glycine betaine/proline transport system permease protein
VLAGIFVGGTALESWFTEPKIPLGRWVKIGITWLQDNAAGFFDAVTALIDFLVDGFTAILLHIPFLLVVFALAALAYWMHRSWRLAAFVVIAFIAIANLG